MDTLWEKLKKTEKPIVMYGMGNGADKILARCEEKGIEIKDFFASDGFVRGHSFHGKRVLSFAEVREKYGDFIILISFASYLESVLDIFYALDREYEVYAPDVPVAGEGTFDGGYYEKHRCETEYSRGLFEDEESKRVFDCVINFKLTGKLEYLRESECEKDAAYALLRKVQPFIVDAGAYTGDTAKEFLSRFEGVKKIVALEPDPKTFKKLLAYSETEPRVFPVNAAAYKETAEKEFDASSNRNANLYSLGKRKAKINCVAIDDLVSEAPSLIKYDVEGAEKDALTGSSGTIKKYAPDLIVSAYHRNEDIFELPVLIKKLRPGYKLYLRRFRYVPAWDLNIFATKEETT